jgi:hypothetical protein
MNCLQFALNFGMEQAYAGMMKMSSPIFELYEFNDGTKELRQFLRFLATI